MVLTLIQQGLCLRPREKRALFGKMVNCEVTTHVNRCTYLNIELNLKIHEIVTLDKKSRARTPHSLKFHMGMAIASNPAPPSGWSNLGLPKLYMVPKFNHI